MDAIVDQVEGLPKPAATPGEEAVRRVAEAKEGPKVPGREPVLDVDDESAEDATSWLLASFRDELPPAEHTLKIEVGSPSQPKKIAWRIKALPRETIDKIRERTMPAGGRRSGLTVDPKAQYAGNISLIVEATVSPDVRAVAQSTGLNAPDEFVKDAFRFNSGLVDQIASAILSLSGYDEDNVQDDVAAAATGN